MKMKKNKFENQMPKK